MTRQEAEAVKDGDWVTSTKTGDHGRVIDVDTEGFLVSWADQSPDFFSYPDAMEFLRVYTGTECVDMR